MRIIVAGLGRMGMQIARKLAEGGHEVIATNRSPEPVEEAVGYGAKGAKSKEDAITQFGDGKIYLWLMVPSEVVAAEIESWLSILPAGSVIIDGGNSDWRETRKHSQLVAEKGHTLLDVGTSGGVWGYRNGFSMMAGGDQKAFSEIEPALKTLAAPGGAYYHFGDSGAGHFVKMTHNAIEYGMMQSLAEGYRLLREGPYDDIDLAAAGDVWQHHSVVTSWLNELCRDALKENPQLDGIDGVVAESGEARWALETSLDLKIPMPAIQTAFDVRLKSQEGETNFSTKLLAAMRNKFGGHILNPKD